MGGHMASLAASNYPKPLVLVPCLSWSTASSVFTEGVMSYAINWDLLQTQYYADGQYREKLMKMVTVVDEAFNAGKHFIQNFQQSMKELREDIKDTIQMTMEDDKVSLTCINDTNPLQMKNKFLEINGRSNKLNLSEGLLNKLLSGESIQLTALEINELNFKIKLALKNWQKDRQSTTNISADSTANLGIVQSDTSSFDPSTLFSSAYNISRTKLMNLLSTSATKSNSDVPEGEKVQIGKTNWWEREITQFMRGMMDECTHLKNFSIPYDTSLIIAVCAKDDAYVPREGCTSLEEIWPGAEVRYLQNHGHVSAYVLHQKLFRKCIIEAFERSKKKWLAEKEAKRNQQTRAIAPLYLTENLHKFNASSSSVECH
jgi:Alpha/beta hydrolase domain containing 18